MEPDCSWTRTILPVWLSDRHLLDLLLGCCVTHVERAQILCRANIPTEGLSAYGVYDLLKKSVRDENALSGELNDYLGERFEAGAVSLRGMDEETFLAQCRHSFAAGVFGPGLWAAATRPDISFSVRHELAGMVHLAMLESFAAVRTVNARIADLEQKNQAQADKLRELRHKLESVQTCKCQQEGQQELPLALAEDHCLWSQRGPELERENAELRDLLEESLDLQTGQDEKIRQLAEELELLRREIPSCGAACSGNCGGAGCDEACPAFDLCHKRVLIVGGVERMEPQYRSLVESCGGILDYHDGKMQGGARKLERSLQRADIIICPVNCNSHGACLMVKSLAKKHRKTVHLLPNASISTVTRVFGEVVSSGQA